MGRTPQARTGRRWLNTARRQARASRNRKPLIIGLSVAAAVVVVVVVVAAIVTFSGSGASGSAGDAVKGYLEALSRGDAAAALSYSTDQPASKDLLSDDILKKQIARWPISDVKILDDNSRAQFRFRTGPCRRQIRWQHLRRHDVGQEERQGLEA